MALVSPPSEQPSHEQVATIGRSDGRTYLHLHGEHDLARLTELRAALAKAVDGDKNDLVVDLSDVEFICAGTIGAFFRSRMLLKSLARTMTVHAPRPHTQRILAICEFA